MKIKASDYIIKLLQDRGVDTVFCITGGAAAHLMESVRASGMTVIHNYNEQACAMAADGYARIAKKPALVLITNGPGSSNAITGVLGAWQDSVPMIVISGQVPRHQTMSADPIHELRQLGLQEAAIIPMVQHCTNYAVQLHELDSVKQEVERAWHLATTGRMGPSWLDIPIDLQAEMINPDDQRDFVPYTVQNKNMISDSILTAIAAAQRPLIVAGNGIHLANAESEFKDLVKQLQIPVVCTWNAKDLFEHNNPLYVGNFGLLGERAGNFAVQQADLLLVLGSRLSIPVTGYNSKDFSPNSVKIMVDIDANELHKHTLKIDHAVVGNIKDFMPELTARCQNDIRHEWRELVINWKEQLSVFDETHVRDPAAVNSFDFVQHLGTCLEPNDVVVTDMGTSFTCTMQALRHTGQDRLFTSSALCSMGFGLPGAIGASMADADCRVICIAGDGGFQMNIQELQTVVHNKLPIKIIILNNNGLLAISLMQDNLFGGKRFGADPTSGVSSPDFVRVAAAYGIPAYRLATIENVQHDLKNLLLQDGPALIEINMVQNQLLIPRVQSRRDASGKIVSGSLDAMFPFLDDTVLTQLGIE
jgi:acetolactate synthase-1/2/3 large subunit